MTSLRWKATLTIALGRYSVLSIKMGIISLSPLTLPMECLNSATPQVLIKVNIDLTGLPTLLPNQKTTR